MRHAENRLKKKSISAMDQERILQLFDEGFGIGRIATSLRIKYTQVMNLLRKNGRYRTLDESRKVSPPANVKVKG